MDLLSLRRTATVVLTCLLLTSGAAYAQISPGELSKAHAALEGMGNCTNCHALGKEVTNSKCLDCHTELRARVNAGKGLHATFAGKACVECHSEHHGRGFTLVRFDTKSFNHRQTGYVLEGKHTALECARCHTQAHITSADVRANRALLASRTFLGLPVDCNGCHADRHKGQLGAQCQSCHTADGWKPAARFAHDRAKFRLTGKHVQVECGRCHHPVRNDVHTVQYVGLAFERCSSCHADPHHGRFQKPCESCHSTEGWQTGAARSFDHATTKFPLRGRHASVRCEECHTPVRGPDGKTAQNFVIRKFQQCTDCHADAHRGEFVRMKNKGACESCHTENGWERTTFRHVEARYQLRGKHEQVECAKCHGSVVVSAQGRRLPPDLRVQRFSACGDCHQDAHAGQFRRRKDGGACESCHAVEGFLPASYTPADHGGTAFPLIGAHEAVPCAKCHPANAVKAASTRQFVYKTAIRCESCHRDPHGGQFVRTRYAGCEACHNPKAWNNLAFNHDSTGFRLTGKHRDVACVNCHRQVKFAGAGDIRQYAGTPSRCVDCHPQNEAQQAGARRL